MSAQLCAGFDREAALLCPNEPCKVCPYIRPSDLYTVTSFLTHIFLSDLVDGASVTIDEDIIDFANDQGNRWLECECDLTLCPPGRVKWFHDGKVLSSAFGDGYMIISDRLQLTGTSRKRMGAYQCESDGIKSERSIVKNSCKK